MLSAGTVYEPWQLEEKLHGRLIDRASLSVYVKSQDGLKREPKYIASGANIVWYGRDGDDLMLASGFNSASQ